MFYEFHYSRMLIKMNHKQIVVFQLKNFDLNENNLDFNLVYYIKEDFYNTIKNF